MTRNLYRVAFAIMTQGNVLKHVESIQHVLIQVPVKGYIGLPEQIVAFEKQAFNKVFKIQCLSQSKVKFISVEKIPDYAQTNVIQPEIVIDPEDWA